MKSLSLHLLFNISNIPPSVGLFVFVPPSISAVARFFFSMQLLVRLAITNYSYLFGSLCRKLLQWKINERNPFRPAVILFCYPYQLIQFPFFEKKKLCWFVSTMPSDFFRTILAQIQDSWRRLIWNLLATLLAGVPCVIRYICDFRSFSCPNSFREDHNKQILVEAEYDNNQNNNNNNNNNILL